MRVRGIFGVAFVASVLAVVSTPVLGADDSDLRPPPLSSTPYPEPEPGAVVGSPPYPVNENGLSYGSGANVDADDPGPDLVAAYGTNGAFGYVLASDRPQPAETLAEALAHRPETSTIPLYAQDGETVIGSFKISAGTGR